MPIDYGLFLNTSSSELEIAQLIVNLGDMDLTYQKLKKSDAGTVVITDIPYFIILVYSMDTRSIGEIFNSTGISPSIKALFTFNWKDNVAGAHDKFFSMIGKLVTESALDFAVDAETGDNYPLIQKDGKLFVDTVAFKWFSAAFITQLQQSGKELIFVNRPNP